MADEQNFSVIGDDTEEIFLDEEEFEALLKSEGISQTAAMGDFDEDFEVSLDEEIEETSKIEEDGFDENEVFEDEEPEFDDTILYSKEELGETLAATEAVSTKKQKKNKYKEDDTFDDEYDEDEDAEEVVNFFKGGFADKMIYLVGAIIILFAIIVGVVAITGRTRKEVVSGEDLSDVGVTVASIGVIGEEGIERVFGTEAERIKELYEIQESVEYNEIDEETGLVNVSVSLTSILKDLKIKFVNKNNKLVANIPFEVDITDSTGKTTTYKDDDKDGIIYLSGISGGKYSVKMKQLEAYASLYSFSNETESISVKNEIEYTKVDVSNEVKSDANTDKTKEDTKVQETETEGSLKDTVEFVLSTKTLANGDSGYEELSKSKITNPKKTLQSKETAGVSTFRKLVSENEEASAITGFSGKPSQMNVGETAQVMVKTNDSAITAVSWDAEAPLEHEDDGVYTTLTAGAVSQDTTARVSCTVSFLNGQSQSASFEVVVKGSDKSEFNMDLSMPSLFPGGSFDIPANATFTIKNKAGKAVKSGYTLSYSSSKESVATVDSSGVVTAVKKGSATITVSCSAENMTTLSCSFKVTVASSGVTITLDSTSKTIFLGDTETASLKATVTGATSDSTVTWESSDESIVTISKTGELTPVKEGTAKITCKSAEAPKVTATCDIKVVLHPSKNTVTLLTDKNGNQVFVYDSTTKKYRQAVYADYYTADKFYTAVDVKYIYTGWWTLSGKTYYFDKNGNKVTGEQVILGTKYNFGSDGALVSGTGSFGIDVSKWNGTINWSNVANSGVSFAIIRCGFRGSTEGGLFVDSMFATNIKNATNSGIKVGVYYFTQAVNEVEAVEEASAVLGLVSGYKISYPIFIDVESAGSGARAENLSASERTAVIKAFCKTIANSGYTAGIYANKTWFTSKINTSELTAYKIWLAQYNTSVTYTASRYDLWQYTEKGSISGISGTVDLDRSYLGY